jgi:hypothetical protein
MTTFTKTTIMQPMTHPIYKLGVLVYIIYFIFSAQVFAQTVQAPNERDVRMLAIAEPTFLQEMVSELSLPVEDTRAQRIEAYYNRHNLPLAKYAQEFVDAADKYGIDWRLLPAIGFIESTGGKYSCQKATYSPFGWGSCKINFDSYEHAINVVSMNLGGHNPNTEYFYKDKTLKEVLYAYNSVIPTYRQKILREMDRIEYM